MVASKYLPTPYSPRRVKRAGSGPMICISLFCRCTSRAMRISWVPEAFFDISKCLETPDIDEAAPLYALPHEHQVVPVHALHEMLGRIHDQDVVQALAQIPHKDPRQ